MELILFVVFLHSVVGQFAIPTNTLSTPKLEVKPNIIKVKDKFQLQCDGKLAEDFLKSMEFRQKDGDNLVEYTPEGVGGEKYPSQDLNKRTSIEPGSSLTKINMIYDSSMCTDNSDTYHCCATDEVNSKRTCSTKDHVLIVVDKDIATVKVMAEATSAFGECTPASSSCDKCVMYNETMIPELRVECSRDVPDIATAKVKVAWFEQSGLLENGIQGKDWASKTIAQTSTNTRGAGCPGTYKVTNSVMHKPAADDVHISVKNPQVKIKCQVTFEYKGVIDTEEATATFCLERAAGDTTTAIVLKIPTPTIYTGGATRSSVTVSIVFGCLVIAML